MIRSLLWILLVLLTAGVVNAQPPADVVFAGGIVYTMTSEGTRAEAVAMRDGKIVFVGNNKDALRHRGADTRWIDASGLTILPGLVDAHGHLRNLGRYASTVQLVGSTSMNDVYARVVSYQESIPAGRWIRGRGWDQNDWDKKEFPTSRDLEGTEANPVYLRRVDGHAAVVNQTALDLCGITGDTPDPDGGRIVRDSEGNPTGLFIDNATDLITEHIPNATPEQLDEWMTKAIKHCNALGLVGVHDAGITSEMLASLERIAANDGLPLRVYCMLDSDDELFLEEQLTRGPRVLAHGQLVIRAFKVYADGALGSRGAALLSAYSDDRENIGLMLSDQEKLNRLATRGVQTGFQVCVHAIGDRGNRAALDAFEAALGGSDGELRFRVEHCQVLALDDISRFAELKVIASMQPTHCTSDMYWAEDRVGRERVQGAYVWRTLIDSGARLTFGSDFPVESANPLWGIYAAITRQDHEGWPEGGWFPGERLSIYEAVQAFTLGPAYASFSESETGTIVVGKRADVTVLDRNIFESHPKELLQAMVTHTVTNGVVVYASSP